ncbi:MAG: hypothetical protein IT258_04855 [Saprospiraceae bacterium]|nr:hypothetical protein [Saprospiraceae bacterium]
MKKAFVIFTTAIIFISSMSNAILFADFKLNQAEIERLYCVNKAKPQQQCHGKCHLKKQLEANNSQNGQPTPASNLEDSFKLNFFHQTISDLAFKDERPDKQLVFAKDQVLNSRLFGISLFRPPDALPAFC